MNITSADWLELSLVNVPAFSAAQISEVAASAAEDEPTELPNLPEEEPEMIDIQNPEQAETVATAPIVQAAARSHKMPTLAEYVAAMAVGGITLDNARAAIRATAGEVITSDTPGLLPESLIGPVYSNFRGLRPTIDAFGPKGMTSAGKVFIRPSVTVHSSIGQQATENTSLTLSTFEVSQNPVYKLTFGGVTTISEQDIDWSDPNVVGLILDDMGRIYANETDAYVATEFSNGVTTSVGFSPGDLTVPAAWSAWCYQAASDILTSSNGNLPSHLFLSPDIWAALGQLSDDAGRPLFPNVGPMNAFGNVTPGTTAGNAFGLQIVVDRNFPSETLIIGATDGFEVFEQQKGAISVDVPATLSRTIAWRGYLGTLMIDDTKFRSADFS